MLQFLKVGVCNLLNLRVRLWAQSSRGVHGRELLLLEGTGEKRIPLFSSERRREDWE